MTLQTLGASSRTLFSMQRPRAHAGEANTPSDRGSVSVKREAEPFGIPGETLKEKLKWILREGGVTKGNGPDAPSVIAFDALMGTGKVQPGDIIVAGDAAKPELAPFDHCIPGRNTHAGMYMGKDEKGAHLIVEAWLPDVIARDAEWWPRNYDSWAVLRPRKADGSPLTPEERRRVVDFAKSAVGCRYTFNFLRRDANLPVHRSRTGFYCSQLAWAAFYHGAGVDIDSNPGVSLRALTAVLPQELREYRHMEVVGAYEPPHPVTEREMIWRIAGGAAVGSSAAVTAAAFLAGATCPAAAAIAALAVGAVNGVAGAWLGATLADVQRLVRKLRI